MANTPMTGMTAKRPLRAGVAPLLLLVLACVFFLLPAADATAQDPIVQYDYGYDPNAGPTGGVNNLMVSEDFACNADGSTTGTLFVNEQCNSAGMIGVFANVVCRIENLFGTVMGLVYCSVQNAIIKPLLALFTLYVTIYGAMVILGMVGHTFSEALSRVFKIALVSAIALNADVAIGVGYKFYIGAAQTSVGIVFDLFDPDTGDIYADNPAMLQMVESGYMASPTAADEAKQLRSGEHWIESIDATLHKIIGFFVEGGVGFAIVMAGLFIFMPPLFFIILYLIISILKAFTQAIIGYLLALLGITMLFTVAPLFVSFALFRVTAGWFEVWLRYLASFTVQLMIVFTFFMIMVMVDLVTFFQSIGSMVRQYQYVFSFGFIHRAFEVYTLCEVERNGNGDIRYFKFNENGIMSSTEGSQYEGFPQCIPEYTLEDAISGSRFPPGLNAEDMAQIRDMANEVNNNPDLIPAGDQMPEGFKYIQGIIDKANHDLKIPFTEIINQEDLVFFLLVRFLVVILLTYLLDRFMKQVPHLASYLAGTSFSGRLGGGENAIGEAPGVQDTVDFGGLDSGLAKFKAANAAKGGWGLRNAPSRFMAGVSAFGSGAGYGMVRKGLVNSGNLGLRGDLRRELAESSEILESQREGLFAPSRGGIGRPSGIYHPGGRAGRTLPSTYKGHRKSRRGM